MTMTSWYADTDYHNHDDDDNDWLCIILAGYQLLMATLDQVLTVLLILNYLNTLYTYQ